PATTTSLHSLISYPPFPPICSCPLPPPPPRSPLFPYTTLFRSPPRRARRAVACRDCRPLPAGAGRGGARDPAAGRHRDRAVAPRSEEHTSELQSPYDLVCRLLLEKKKKKTKAERTDDRQISQTH